MQRAPGVMTKSGSRICTALQCNTGCAESWNYSSTKLEKSRQAPHRAQSGHGNHQFRPTLDVQSTKMDHVLPTLYCCKNHYVRRYNYHTCPLCYSSHGIVRSTQQDCQTTLGLSAIFHTSVRLLTSLGKAILRLYCCLPCVTHTLIAKL